MDSVFYAKDFDTPIFNCILLFLYKSGMILLLTINTINCLLKSSHFQCLKLWEYPGIIFWFKFRIFPILIILIFWFYIYFWKILIDYQKLALLSKTIKNFKGFNSVEFIVFVWNFVNVFSLAMPTRKC